MINKNDNYYKTMFSTDITNLIEFGITKYRNSRCNIEIESTNKELAEEYKKYFQYNDVMYLEYDFLEEVAKTIVRTILNGSGIAQIVKYKDEFKKVNGIEIRNLDYIFRVKIPFYTCLIVNGYGFPTKYRMLFVKNKEIITIKRKKLGISNYKTNRMLLNLDAENSMKVVKLLQNNLLLEGDYEKIETSQKVKLLKVLEEIKWDGRLDGFEFLNEPYVLYRQVQLDLVLINMLNIMIDLINNKLEKQKDINIKRKN